LIEVSGNVNLDNLEDICRTGIDLISVGYITHSAPAIDFSLEFDYFKHSFSLISGIFFIAAVLPLSIISFP
jgi:hypothetical protein